MTTALNYTPLNVPWSMVGMYTKTKYVTIYLGFVNSTINYNCHHHHDYYFKIIICSAIKIIHFNNDSFHRNAIRVLIFLT